MTTNMFKYIRRNTLALLGSSLLIAGISSCTKWDTLSSPEEGKLYMSRAYSSNADLTVYKIKDSIQSFVFGASVTGFHGASKDEVVTFEVDTTLVAQYNELYYYLNTTYQVLPSSAYTLSSTTTTIRAGKTDSDPLTLNIDATDLNTEGNYLLPIKIKSSSIGSEIDSTLGVAYFKLAGISVRTNDVTSEGVLTVNSENSNGPDAAEASKSLVDGNIATKYLTFNYFSGMWMQLKYSTPISIDAYALTSANDAESRDPFVWDLQASDDGVTWKTVDHRDQFVFSSRQQTVRFEPNESDGQPHLYYRLYIDQNRGSSLFQMSEWSMLQYY